MQNFFFSISQKQNCAIRFLHTKNPEVNKICTTPNEILNNVFGLPCFRMGQDLIINSVIEGNNAFVLMPTGGGKSLIYQILSIYLSGCGIVVSPLISLMDDQIASLLISGVKCATLNSSLDFSEIGRVEEAFVSGALDILYVSPERLLTDRFQSLMKKANIALFAIDEAHCLSQWGHEFRREYQQLSFIAKQYPNIPRIALTATADQVTRQDIISQLDLQNGKHFIGAFDRPNIFYTVTLKQGATGLEQLSEFLEKHKDETGIVYCSTRKAVDKTTQFLIGKGFKAYAYHAGMEVNQKSGNHSLFLTEDDVIIVATVAFGLGINKPIVRFVCHLSLPSTLEAYYQETGRAGRDGLPSHAWMLYSMKDISFHRKNLGQKNIPDEIKKHEGLKLNAMVAFCNEIKCRRENILSYFSDKLVEKSDHCCDLHSDNVPILEDCTVEAKKAISCVYRTNEQFGMNHCVNILMGSKSARVLQFNHHKLSVYGIGKDWKKNAWINLFHQLISMELLRVDSTYNQLKITPSAAAFIKEKKKIEMKRDRKVEDPILSRYTHAESNLNPEETLIFNKLQVVRNELANQLKVPSYIIAMNITLHQIAKKQPQSLNDFRGIFGLGEIKIEKYCPHFLHVTKNNYSSE
jgi:ATP-dependent DNA helicase RecQ